MLNKFIKVGPNTILLLSLLEKQKKDHMKAMEENNHL